MFTINHPELGTSYRIVLETRQDGAFLIADDQTPPKLHWVRPDECTLGQLYMTQDQREWWAGIRSRGNQNEGNH